jgi:hypothetical protein
MWETRNQGSTKNSHFGHCTHTAGCNFIKAKTFNIGKNTTCTVNCNHIIAAAFYTLETWFVSGI